MAFSVAEDREAPDATLVEYYGVSRLGREANLKVVYVEVVYDTEPFVGIEALEDVDGDGLFEVLTISAWAARTDLVGRELFDVARQSVGIVAAFADAETLEDGTVVPAKVTLSAGLSSSSLFEVTLRRRMIGIDVPAYRVARGGRRWEVHFGTGSTEGAALVAQLMGAAYYNAVAAVLNQMGVSYTPQDLVAAITATGENIDSYLAAQGEIVEEQRRTGQLPWLLAPGDAPLAA